MNKKLAKILIPIAAVIAVAAAVIIILTVSGKSDKAVPLSDAQLSSPDSVTLISHRGMRIAAPENTVEAVIKSAQAGYRYVEFDVRRTLDGMWVLMHDSDIKRTTNGKGEISEITYKQLLSYRIDSGNGIDEYELVTVPTIEQILTACAENGLVPVIEIKQSGTEHIQELLSIVADRWSNECKIITFNREQAELVHSIIQQGSTTLLNDNVTVMWLTNDLSEETLATAKSNTAIHVSFNGNEAGKAEEIKAFTDAGISLATWTVNKAQRVKELNDLGITWFTTDNIVYNQTANGEN